MPFKEVQEVGRRKALEIAEQILQSIRNGEYKKGDKLPSEKRIAELTGVGRPVIREALSALHIVGIIKTKVGDGSYVQTDSSDEIQSKILALLESNRNPFETLQARRYLEGGIVELATEVVTFAELTELEGLIKEANAALDAVNEEISERIFRIHCDHDRAFHAKIAEITGNSLLINHMQFYSEIMHQERMWPSLYRKIYSHKKEVKEALEEHFEIIKAMATKEIELVREAVYKHFDNVRRRIIKYESDYIHSNDRI